LRSANQEKTDYQEQNEAIQHEMSRTKYKLAEVDKLKKKVKEEKVTVEFCAILTIAG
jgi:hypothetical protein